jgi:broad specificity phosphatase PhoE
MFDDNRGMPSLDILALRHSIKSKRYPNNLPDINRPLSPEGIRLAIANAVFLTRRLSVESSPYLRAIQTSEHIIHTGNFESKNLLPYPRVRVRSDLTIYNGSFENSYHSLKYYIRKLAGENPYEGQESKIPGIRYAELIISKMKIYKRLRRRETNKIVAGRLARLILPKITAYKRLMQAGATPKSLMIQSQKNPTDFQRIMISHQGNIEGFYFELLRIIDNTQELYHFVNAVGGNGMKELSGFKLRVNPIVDKDYKIIDFQTIFNIYSGDGKYHNTIDLFPSYSA